jgi:hypothetical protein
VTVKRLAISLTCALLWSGPGRAQSPDAPPVGYAFQVEVTDRWLHGSQRPEFTRWNVLEPSTWLTIDSVRPLDQAGTRALRIEAGRGRHVRIVHDRVGRILELEATTPTPPWESMENEYARAVSRSLRGSRFESLSSAGVHAVDAAALVPGFDPPRLEPGAVWVDTIRVEGEQEEHRRSVAGVRTSSLARDTLVSGRRLWVVRDSAFIRYEERWVERDRTLDTLVVVERCGDGVVRGVHLYDPELGLFLTRNDTTRLVGEAVLRYPDDRVFRTPASYERLARWRLHDPESTEARREEQLAAMRYQRDMLPRHGSEVERRLLGGDERLRDSLIVAWHRSREPEERTGLFRMVWSASRGEPGLLARLFDLALEAGDTVFAIRDLQRVDPRAPLDRRSMELLLPFLRDPGRSLAFGLGRDTFYEYVREALLRSPPAITADPAAWPCTPEACRLLAAQYDTPGDPRLRDLALIARFVMEPTLWDDEIAARAEDGSELVWPAAQLMAGVRSLAPSVPPTFPLPPLPEERADWRAWLQWMGGLRPGTPLPPGAAEHAPTVRFDPGHETAIRFFQARTGRSLIDEVRRGYEQAETDSARLVFLAILVGMGERWTDPDELAEVLRSGSEAERALARSRVTRLFASAPLAEPEVEAEVVHRMLEVLILGAERWPDLHPAEATPRRTVQRPPAARPRFLLTDGLPAGLLARWRDQATLIRRAEWEMRAGREPAIVIRPHSVHRAGPFVQVRVDYESWTRRDPDQPPANQWASYLYILLESPDGWRLVEELMMIS